MKPARILVVDDEPGMLRAVRRILSPRYQVTEATTPTQALSVLPELQPELAIVDVRMPEMDGFELTSRLKRARPDLDVILMTGSLSELDAKMVRAIRENAFYFIQKPFDRELLTTLVERCFELRRLSEENRRHTLRLESELAQARVFQGNLLPPREAVVEGLRVAARYRPCSELGGDLVDYAAAGPGRAALLVADVSGHGVSAAMLTGIVKTAFRSARDDGFDPLPVVERLWGALGSFDDARFVTLVAAVVDLTRETMTYVNAGHPAPFVWNDGASPAALPSTGPLISAALPGLTWSRETIPFPPGTRLLLYTDGITEASGEDGDFGFAGIVREIASNFAGGVALLDAVLEAVRRHGKGRPQEDDWTLLTASF
ncbi:MAG TPA: SpoIIE family protein phosphatase [Candidatus Polarisedimenticolaceae bacterium]|nr:SpoIIE family protein phosphatase [Candidatus Polarisedimenticolaceae bacterium]